jgi:hypothetical protein
MERSNERRNFKLDLTKIQSDTQTHYNTEKLNDSVGSEFFEAEEKSVCQKINEQPSFVNKTLYQSVNAVKIDLNQFKQSQRNLAEALTRNNSNTNTTMTMRNTIRHGTKRSNHTSLTQSNKFSITRNGTGNGNNTKIFI